MGKKESMERFRYGEVSSFAKRGTREECSFARADHKQTSSPTATLFRLGAGCRLAAPMSKQVSREGMMSGWIACCRPRGNMFRVRYFLFARAKNQEDIPRGDRSSVSTSSSLATSFMNQFLFLVLQVLSLRAREEKTPKIKQRLIPQS